jgi:hypothetical protein
MPCMQLLRVKMVLRILRAVTDLEEASSESVQSSDK